MQPFPTVSHEGQARSRPECLVRRISDSVAPEVAPAPQAAPAPAVEPAPEYSSAPAVEPAPEAAPASKGYVSAPGKGPGALTLRGVRRSIGP